LSFLIVNRLYINLDRHTKITFSFARFFISLYVEVSEMIALLLFEIKTHR